MKRLYDSLITTRNCFTNGTGIQTQKDLETNLVKGTKYFLTIFKFWDGDISIDFIVFVKENRKIKWGHGPGTLLSWSALVYK